MGTSKEISPLASLISLASLAWILDDWPDGLFNSQADFFTLFSWWNTEDHPQFLILEFYLFFELSKY